MLGSRLLLKSDLPSGPGVGFAIVPDDADLTGDTEAIRSDWVGGGPVEEVEDATAVVEADFFEERGDGLGERYGDLAQRPIGRPGFAIPEDGAVIIRASGFAEGIGVLAGDGLAEQV